MTQILSHPDQIEAMQRDACYFCGLPKVEHVVDHDSYGRPGLVCPQREAGRSAEPVLTPGDQVRIPVPADRATPKLSYQTIGTGQRRAVIDQIAGLTALLTRDKDEGTGCCYNRLCAVHHASYTLALLRLKNYAVVRTSGGAK